jgi:hypothetical protein
MVPKLLMGPAAGRFAFVRLSVCLLVQLVEKRALQAL